MKPHTRRSAMKLKQRNCFLWFSALTCSFGGFVLLIGRNYTATVPALETFNVVNGDPVRVEFKPRWPAKCHPVTKLAFSESPQSWKLYSSQHCSEIWFHQESQLCGAKKTVTHICIQLHWAPEGQRIQKQYTPPPPGETYDILWNHVTYHHDAFRDVMPKETRYISILREPFDQFVSAFEYYVLVGKHRKKILQQQRNPLAAYLDKEKPVSSKREWVRNSQSNDMGFKFSALSNRTAAMAYISQIEKDFDLVMLMEYFDESLVLLKRTLCWSLKDILYFLHNKNTRRQHWMFSQEHYRKHQNLSRADYDLYTHFRKVFWKKVWSQGSDFFDEVRYFKQLLSQLRDYCVVGRTLEVAASRWEEGFVVDNRDCFYMNISELAFFDRIINTTYAKISSKVNTFHRPH